MRDVYTIVMYSPIETVLQLILIDMKRTILDQGQRGLTAKTTSQRNEVLFFSHPLFLFFNFMAATHLAHLVLSI
jgi:hypothetical protein